jgi:hypothetical protein
MVAPKLVVMFERFTDDARRVLVCAQDEASQLGHRHIGTEHIVLGLLREGDCVAARALESLGIGLQSARDRLQADERGSRQPRRIPFTPEAKRALEFSLRDALLLGQDYIGTEHILLALARDSATRGARMLTELGAPPEAVRQRVLEIAPPGPAGQVPAIASSAVRLRTRGNPSAGYGALNSRLGALERWVGLVPDLADLDEQIEQVHRDTDAAIDAQEFRTAEALSDSEHELIAERDRRSRQRRAGPSLADQVARLQAEVDRLQKALRSRGIDPDSS